MKKAKLTLTLNKETVANLNSSEMNEVKGGTERTQVISRCCQDFSVYYTCEWCHPTKSDCC